MDEKTYINRLTAQTRNGRPVRCAIYTSDKITHLSANQFDWLVQTAKESNLIIGHTETSYINMYTLRENSLIPPMDAPEPAAEAPTPPRPTPTARPTKAKLEAPPMPQATQANVTWRPDLGMYRSLVVPRGRKQRLGFY